MAWAEKWSWWDRDDDLSKLDNLGYPESNVGEDISDPMKLPICIFLERGIAIQRIDRKFEEFITILAKVCHTPQPIVSDLSFAGALPENVDSNGCTYCIPSHDPEVRESRVGLPGLERSISYGDASTSSKQREIRGFIDYVGGVLVT